MQGYVPLFIHIGMYILKKNSIRRLNLVTIIIIIDNT